MLAVTTTSPQAPSLTLSWFAQNLLLVYFLHDPPKSEIGENKTEFKGDDKTDVRGDDITEPDDSDRILTDESDLISAPLSFFELISAPPSFFELISAPVSILPFLFGGNGGKGGALMLHDTSSHKGVS